MTITNTRRLRGTIGSLAVLATVPFLLVACSGQPDADGALRADAGIGAQWGACMRDAGFDVTDPDDAAVQAGVAKVPAGADQAAFQAAAASCAQHAGVTGASSAERDRWEREYAAVASCVREHGYADLPEQQPGSITVEGYPRAEEPAFEQVMDDCMAEYSPDTKPIGG